MGFVLSILYFVTCYLTPEVVFGPLARFRIELIIAVLVFFASIGKLPKSFIMKTPQSLALIGLAFAAMMSILVGTRWAGGAVQAFLGFLPNAYGYFLVGLNCDSKRKLQVLVLMLLFVCFFVIGNGSYDLRNGVGSGPVQTLAGNRVDLWNINHWTAEHPYIDVAGSDTGLYWNFRLKGLGVINDPNDFGQLTVCVIPLVFIFWRRKSALLNMVLVILPVCVLIYGIYLTHSRGALLALVAVAIVFLQRHIGRVPSLVFACGLFVGAMAMNFTGGREISASSGEDRVALWGAGLHLFETHPFFGVGIGRMMDHASNTAHNSIVVCAAELGMLGLYFWSMFMLPTVRDSLAVASPRKVSEGEPAALDERAMPYMTTKLEAIDRTEILRLGRLALLSLTGFLVAGWFLSRAFIMTLYLLGGIVEVIFQMALDRGMIGPRLRLGPVLRYSGLLACALVVIVYVLVRILNFAR